MRSLALALLLCVLPSLLHAACFRSPKTPGMTKCQDSVDKTWHPVGSSWRNSACMDCTCTGCCDGFETPRQYPDDCVAEFDAKACKYRVHKKNDPSTECPVFASVGK